jgi:hypothetical protein
VGVYDQTARAIGKTPVWIFHGGADDTVPVEESRQMFAALKKSGGVVRYYEYEGVGHNSWDKAYAEPEFPQWLLSKRLGRGESSPAEMKVVPAHPAAVQVDAKILAQYAGVYEHEMRPVAMVRQSVIFENGGLNLQFGANRILPLLALSEQEFFTEKPEDVRYIFQRNSRGEVGSFIRRDKRHDEVFRTVAH